VLRCMRLVIGLILISSVAGRDARAQWGWEYGGWGWEGWGGVATPESAELHSAGIFAMGAGIYNLNTAKADKINAQTAIKWNDYVAQVTHESARIYAERRDQRLARNRALYDARQQRLRDNPGRVDVENGNALNLAVSDLSDPRLGRSALRAATIPVPASLIATVPFIYASERITLMLEELRASVKWPEVFDDPRFADDRKTFDDLVARIRAEANEDDVSPRLMREARGFLQGLRSKLETMPLKDPDHQDQALRFVTACTSLLGLLEKPNIRPALVELKKVQDTTLGNLLGFMHAYNLRFGVATTPDQRRAYGQIFTILDRTRDQILADAKLPPQAAETAGAKAAADFFQDLNRGRPSKAAPPRP
jgi:hypothetical protein